MIYTPPIEQSDWSEFTTMIQIYLYQPVMVPTVCIWQMLGLKRMDFAKNAWVESYGDKYLSRLS